MSVRVTLAPATGRTEFEQYAFGHGWRLHDRVERSEMAPFEEIWLLPGDRGAVHYIEDHLLGVPYAVVTGGDEEAVAADITSGVATISLEQALEMVRWAKTSDERIDAVSFLAAAAPVEADPDAVEAFAALFRDPEPDVRQAAVFASSYPSWRELDEALEQMQRVDPEARLREAAAQALQAIRRHRDGAPR
jgi:hypothetical protein